MKTSFTRLLPLLALSLIAGCASQHRQTIHFPDQRRPIENPEKSRIYVLREPWLWNLASRMALVSFSDGDQPVGQIAGRRGYLCWERDPGQVALSSLSPGSDKPTRIHFPVTKGKTYYVIERLVPRADGGMTAHLALVDEEKGRQELKKCKPPQEAMATQGQP
jgi:hypothetical protein